MNNSIKNIIIIYDQPYYSGGAAKIAIDTAIKFSNDGFNVYFFTGINKICEELLKSKVNVICLNERHIAFSKNPITLLKGLYNFNAYFKLKELLDKLESTDTIIHVHGWTKCLSVSIFDAIREKNFKFIITLHEYFSVCQNGGLFNFKTNKICDLKGIKCYKCNCDKRNYFNKIYRNMRMIIQNNVLSKCDLNFIHVTNFSKKIIENRLSVKYKNSFVVNNFIDLKNEKRICCEKNKKYAFIGRVSNEKGIEVFCQIITRYKLSGIVIGDGPLYKYYKEKYPNITFYGWKNSIELLEIQQKIRAIIITSKWYETMGLTVVEGQNLGIPSIIPSHCAATENIIDNKNARIYDINNITSIEKILKDFENDLYLKKMSEYTYDSFEKNKYSIESHVKKLLYVYEKILKG